MSVEIQADALTGMLTDLLSTASKDDHPQMFHAVHLYTAEREGSSVLVGESTDRFVAGQAWERASGELSPVLIDVSVAKAVLTNIKGMPRATLVTLSIVSGLVLESEGLRVEHSTVNAEFPKLASHVCDNEETVGVRLSESILSPLVAIAKRRREPMQFEFSGQRKAVRIRIGEQYQAIAMPMQNDLIDVPSLLSPPEVEVSEVA